MHHAKYAINHFSNTIKGTSIIMHNPPKGLWMIIAKGTSCFCNFSHGAFTFALTCKLKGL